MSTQKKASRGGAKLRGNKTAPQQPESYGGFQDSEGYHVRVKLPPTLIDIEPSQTCVLVRPRQHVEIANVFGGMSENVDFSRTAREHRVTRLRWTRKQPKPCSASP